MPVAQWHQTRAHAASPQALRRRFREHGALVRLSSGNSDRKEIKSSWNRVPDEGALPGKASRLPGGQKRGHSAFVPGPLTVRGRAKIGLRVSKFNGIGLDLSGSYDGIGIEDYDAFIGKAAVQVPLN